MRPLETHVQMTSHFMMYNRVKELLTREGLLTTDPSDVDIRLALDRWVAMVERAANRDEDRAR